LQIRCAGPAQALLPPVTSHVSVIYKISVIVY
jgi:hypothetical protein